MTDSAKGKLPLDAQVHLNDVELADAEVCIHFKGFARATVTQFIHFIHALRLPLLA